MVDVGVIIVVVFGLREEIIRILMLKILVVVCNVIWFLYLLFCVMFVR